MLIFRLLRDLELSLNSNFSFDQHCLNNVDKLSRLIKFIFRNFEIRNDEFLDE